MTGSTRRLLEDAARRGAGYLEGLDGRPVFPRDADVERLREALAGDMPEVPSPDADVLAFLDEYGSPATVASAGGRYFGFVTGGTLPASLAAHILTSAWDQNSFSFISSPASALFGEVSLRWLKGVFGLPQEAIGALVLGATAANFSGLAAARHAVLKRAGWDVEERGLRGAPDVSLVVGEEAHGTIFKVLPLLGFGRAHIHRVPADDQGRLRADRLPRMAGPTIACIQAGNVNSGAFDPAREIVDWARGGNAWVHVDGAFGLWAAASERRRTLMDGFAGADSWATDAHKWLNVPYDCGIAFVRDADALRAAMSISGDYLMLGSKDAIDLTSDGSRRARGFDVWAALQSLGRRGLADLVDRNCDQAAWLAAELRRAGLEVLNEVVLNQVVVAFGDDARTKDTIRRLQKAGECWCGGTRWHGREAMRISVSAWATTQQDLDRTLASILRAAAGA
ncbi:MAG TPA: pyridoxal-dependent decarboxylase [Steroidobacteraceae bacterium]|nr:pyridoxal-dependent decarboxylase [Steroidobacteraceae bacterium]